MYYKVVVEVIDFLIIMYNVLGCIGLNMMVEIMLELVEVLNIVVMKEVFGNMD